MAADRWRPLFRRDEDSAREYDALYEGVPDWLAPSLLAWLEACMPAPYWALEGERVAYLLRAERTLRVQLTRGSADRTIAGFLTQVLADEQLFLEAIDWTLNNFPAYGREPEVAQLHDMLVEGGSAWRVRPEYPYGLERRVEDSMQALADDTIAVGDRPARLLSSAWTKSFGRSADPSGGYRDAVRAMEAALAPIVSPDNGSTTLGTIIRDISAAPGKLRMRLEPAGHVSAVEVFVQQLRLVWTAQLDRHGTADDSVPLTVSVEQAQDATVVATMVVHLVQAGGFSAV